ncbi:hypothetical protein G0U57_000227 [Chelydra serpentina]|uniref:HAT C-terminal dimerisation domain-containing protein n=1 Tax=Chelydra serpentina TaxID=8475 RepID=A0A8T1S1X8_CHESE|nr:hypothetical protein G0U57_000227 [Chelydra serpentina]
MPGQKRLSGAAYQQQREKGQKELEKLSFVLEKKPRQFYYEAHDDPILSPKESFKVECCILDVAITSAEERCYQLHGHCETFEFLYDIGNIKNQFSKEDLMKHCQDLNLAFSTDNAADIDGVELYDELIALSELIGPKTSPLKVLEFIARNDFFTPNTAIALHILLTLPVSVASGERSFSILKLLKNYLRSTMSQNRLSGLALISIESTIAKNLDFTESFKDYASIKTRKIQFI